MQRVQLKVGQVWKHPNLSDTYTITGFSSGYAQCVRDRDNFALPFIMTDKDGYCSLDPEWTTTNTLTSAKSAVRSKECLCGIHRADCTYHKDQ